MLIRCEFALMLVLTVAITISCSLGSFAHEADGKIKPIQCEKIAYKPRGNNMKMAYEPEISLKT